MSTTQQQIEAFEAVVTRLNASPSVMALVEECEAKQIQGIPRIACDCPITRLVEQELRDAGHQPGYVATGIDEITMDDVVFSMSPVVIQFVDQFDSQVFPQLIDTKAASELAGYDDLDW
jgi:hypothetical protein